MRKFIAVTVLLSFVPAAGQAWAAPAPDALLPAKTVAVLGVQLAEPTVAVTAAAVVTRPVSIRRSLDELGQSTLVLLPNRTERAVAVAQAPTQATGGRGLSTAAKAAIWLSAVTVAAVWGYKTFSVTRGTD